MAKSVNESLLDDAIRHQIDLQKYSNQVVRVMMGLLNRTDDDLYAALTAALANMEPDSFTVTRLQAMLASVRSINASAYAQVGQALPRELKEFTAFELAYQKMALEAVLPVEFTVAAVSVDRVFSTAMATPFQGTILEDAVSNLSETRMRRLEQGIAHGFISGKTAVMILRELRGTRSSGYADGITEIDRRNLQAIVNSAVAHTAAHARDDLFKANESVLKGHMWSAALDQKTTSECRIRDQKMYDLDNKPMGHSIPWGSGPGRLHYNCRSCSTPVVKGFAELLDIQDFDESQFPEGTRASMDGQVPGKVTYNEWLTRQSASRQDEVLGPTRGKLLREGKLSADDMYTNKGEFMTLEELKEKYPKAFRGT